jgi:hypothetical protein
VEKLGLRVNGHSLTVEACDLTTISFEGLELGSTTFILDIEGSERFQVTLHRGLPAKIALFHQIMSVILLPRGTMKGLEEGCGDIHGALLHMSSYSCPWRHRYLMSISEMDPNVVDTRYD